MTLLESVKVAALEIGTVSRPGQIHHRVPVWRIEGVIVAEKHLATLPDRAHSVKVLKTFHREFLLTMLFFEVVKLVLLK